MTLPKEVIMYEVKENTFIWVRPIPRDIRIKTIIVYANNITVFKTNWGISISKYKKSTVIKISGTDKQLVGKVSSEIKNLKPVEPYKGKGIKERGQYVLRKEGKKK